MPAIQGKQQSVPQSPFEPSAWVPLVRSITPRTRFVTLPASFVERLNTGVVTLWTATQADDDDDNMWSDGTPVEALETVPDDEQLRAACAEIDSVIAECDGAVCPKAGTMVPYDATWNTLSRTTRSESGEDVLSLVSASERCANAPWKTLALRQWADIDKRSEYRAFIADGALVGLCPRRRETGDRNDEVTDALVDQVRQWASEIHLRVTAIFGLKYVIDIYAAGNGRLWVIDFAAWGEDGGTDPLCFSWTELNAAEWMNTRGRAQFRSVNEGAAFRPAQEMYYGVPLELRNPDSARALAEAARELVNREEGNERGESGPSGNGRRRRLTRVSRGWRGNRRQQL